MRLRNYIRFACLIAALAISVQGKTSTTLCTDSKKSGDGCTVETEFGTYHLPSAPKSGVAGPQAATLIDLGGPGILPGSLARFDPSTLPPELVQDRLLVVLGSRWGSPEPSQQCSDALHRHVLDARSKTATQHNSNQPSDSAEKAAQVCQLEAATRDYAQHSAAMINQVLEHWDINRYQVVGASFAASRWQGMLAELDEDRQPDSITIVSPLPADTRLSKVADWQASQAAEVWVNACEQLETNAESESCLQALANAAASEQSSGLLMLAWSPQASRELVEYINIQKETLQNFIGKFADRYFLLNAADYPRDELLEYVVGVCSSLYIGDELDANGLATDTATQSEDTFYHTIKNQIRNLVLRHHKICSSMNQGYSKATHEIPTCFIELANDPIVPPLKLAHPSSNSPVVQTIVHQAESTPQHGDFRLLNELKTNQQCWRQASQSAIRVRELAPGMLDEAASLIGPEHIYLPKLANTFNGEFHLGSITLSTSSTTEEKVLPSTIIGYCMAGWLVPEPEYDELGHAYIYGIGLKGEPAPVCEQQNNLTRNEIQHDKTSIRESTHCHEETQCIEQLRAKVVSLTNGELELNLKN